MKWPRCGEKCLETRWNCWIRLFLNGRQRWTRHIQNRRSKACTKAVWFNKIIKQSKTRMRRRKRRNNSLKSKTSRRTRARPIKRSWKMRWRGTGQNCASSTSLPTWQIAHSSAITEGNKCTRPTGTKWSNEPGTMESRSFFLRPARFPMRRSRWSYRWVRMTTTQRLACTLVAPLSRCRDSRTPPRKSNRKPWRRTLRRWGPSSWTRRSAGKWWLLASAASTMTALNTQGRKRSWECFPCILTWPRSSNFPCTCTRGRARRISSEFWKKIGTGSQVAWSTASAVLKANWKRYSTWACTSASTDAHWRPRRTAKW